MVASKRKVKPGRQALFVLGMHRSGTSAVGGLLALLGAQSPRTLMVPTKDNPRGYFESLEFLKVHDRILSSAGSRWNDWGAFNPAWMDSAIAAQLGDTLAALVDREFGDAPLFLIKDPRVCRFFPLWLEALQEKAITPKVMIPLRHPLEVARSLEARDHFSRNRSLLLWLRHMLDAEFTSRGIARTFVRYDDVLDDWQCQARKISTDLGITWPKWSGDTEAKIGEFLSAELRHHTAGDTAIPGDTELADWASQAYAVLLLACSGPLDDDAKGILDRIRSEFDRTSAIYAAVVREHETRVEGLYASVKSRLAEKTEESKALAKVHEDVSGTLAETEKALAEQRGKSASLIQKQDELERKRAELAQSTDQYAARLAVLENQVQVDTVERSQLNSAIAAAKQELAEARVAYQQECDALRINAAGLAERISARDAQLVERAAELADRTDQIKRHVGEVSGLRESLAAAEASKVAYQQECEVLRTNAAALAERICARDAQLAERVAELADRNAQIKGYVEQSSGLRESLAAAEASLSARFKETAKLTEMVFQLEQSVQEQEKLLSQQRTAAAENEVRQQTLVQAHEEQLAAQAREQAVLLEQSLARHIHDSDVYEQKLAKQTQDFEQRLAQISEGYEQKLAKQAHDLEQQLVRQGEDYENKLAKQALDFGQLDRLHQSWATANTRNLALAEYKRAVAQAESRALARELDSWRSTAHRSQQTLARIQAMRAWRLIAPLRPKIAIPAQLETPDDGSFQYQVSLLGRSELFDTRWYLSTYPDVGQSGLDPISHYLLVGAAEGRNPGPGFDTVAYLMDHPDVGHSATNPLVHYIEHGQAESRRVAAVVVPA